MTSDAPRATGDDYKRLFALIKDVKVAMMTTVDTDGTLRSRPMWNQQEVFEGEVWFFTRASAHKVEEIEAEHRVNLSYADPSDQNYVSVSGTARLVRDQAKAKELWSAPMKTWFPKGVDDPDLALLCVKVDQAEYWDAPSSTMVHLYGMAKATLTGKSPHPGDNKKLSFA